MGEDSQIYRKLYFAQRKNFEIVERLKKEKDGIEVGSTYSGFVIKDLFQKILDGKNG